MEIFNVLLCWYENFCFEKLIIVYVSVYVVYIGVYVVIMFLCDSYNYNLMRFR